MLKKIISKLLANNICKNGPYVVFCSANREGQNEELVKYMYEVEKILKHIHFIELDWKDYKKFKNSGSDNYMNCIYAYFNNKLEIFEDNPNSDKLILFFQKVIDFHNKHIDYRISRVGSNIKNNFYEKGICLKNIADKNEKYIRNEKSRLLKKKVKLSISELKEIFVCKTDKFEIQKIMDNILINNHPENDIETDKECLKQSVRIKKLVKHNSNINNFYIYPNLENEIIENNKTKFNMENLKKNISFKFLKYDSHSNNVIKRKSEKSKEKPFYESSLENIEPKMTKKYIFKLNKLSLPSDLSEVLYHKYKSTKFEHPLIKKIKRKYSYIKFPFYNKIIVQ